jgi:hypothetical protein
LAGAALARLDQFDPLLDDIDRAGRAHGPDIGRIDQPQAHRRIAKPHRQGRGLDQPGQPRKIGMGLRGFSFQRAHAAFAVGRIEDPEQRRIGRGHLRIGQPATHRKRAGTPTRNQRHGQRRPGLLGVAHGLRQGAQRLGVEHIFQLSQVIGQGIAPQPAGQPRGALDPPVGADQQRQGGRFLDHAGQLARELLRPLRTGHARTRGQHRPAGHQRPDRQKQRHGHECKGMGLHRPMARPSARN